MAQYGSVTISSPTSLITRVVQSSEAAGLEALVNDAIAALPAGYVVVGITLAGGGDGFVFVVTIDAGLEADVTGGFTDTPSVSCYLGGSADQLALLAAAASPAEGAVADLQVAGASKGTRFMGMFVSGTTAGGGSAISSFATSVTFNMVNGLQRFNAVAVPGLPATALPWTSLDGETTPSDEVAGVCGCWNLGDGTVDLLAIYNGATTSVTVPIRIFWITP